MTSRRTRCADLTPGLARIALLSGLMWATLTPHPAIAQENDFRLALEMVVFSQLDPEASTEDILVTLPDLPPTRTYPAPIQLPDAGPVTPQTPPGVIALTRAQYALDGIWAAMRRSAEYRPLAHFAWAMPADWNGEAIPLRLSTLAAATWPFSGLVTLEEDRFVLVTLDVRMPADEEGKGEYRLAERRRLLLGEIHYFDHPRFGVIVRLFRYRPQPQAKE